MMPGKIVPISGGYSLKRQHRKRRAKATKHRNNWVVRFLNTTVSVRAILLAAVVCGTMAVLITLAIRYPIDPAI